jgi:hypothetical protein
MNCGDAKLGRIVSELSTFCSGHNPVIESYNYQLIKDSGMQSKSIGEYV